MGPWGLGAQLRVGEGIGGKENCVVRVMKGSSTWTLKSPRIKAGVIFEKLTLSQVRKTLKDDRQ